MKELDFQDRGVGAEAASAEAEGSCSRAPSATRFAAGSTRVGGGSTAPARADARRRECRRGFGARLSGVGGRGRGPRRGCGDRFCRRHARAEHPAARCGRDPGRRTAASCGPRGLDGDAVSQPHSGSPCPGFLGRRVHGRRAIAPAHPACGARAGRILRGTSGAGGCLCGEPVARKRSRSRSGAARIGREESLRDHDGARALALLDEHARRFPDGVFLVEAEAARAIATCETGDREHGSQLAAAFARRWPNAPVLARVLAACRIPGTGSITP